VPITRVHQRKEFGSCQRNGSNNEFFSLHFESKVNVAWKMEVSFFPSANLLSLKITRFRLISFASFKAQFSG